MRHVSEEEVLHPSGNVASSKTACLQLGIMQDEDVLRAVCACVRACKRSKEGNLGLAEWQRTRSISRQPVMSCLKA